MYVFLHKARPNDPQAHPAQSLWLHRVGDVDRDLAVCVACGKRVYRKWVSEPFLGRKGRPRCVSRIWPEGYAEDGGVRWEIDAITPSLHRE